MCPTSASVTTAFLGARRRWVGSTKPWATSSVRLSTPPPRHVPHPLRSQYPSCRPRGCSFPLGHKGVGTIRCAPGWSLTGAHLRVWLDHRLSTWRRAQAAIRLQLCVRGGNSATPTGGKVRRDGSGGAGVQSKEGSGGFRVAWLWAGRWVEGRVHGRDSRSPLSAGCALRSHQISLPS